MEDTISLKSNPSTSSLECFICMEKTEDPILNILDYDLARTCRCEGCLHAKCYAQWLRTSTGCPICRKPIQFKMQIEHIAIDNLPNYNQPQNNRYQILSLEICTGLLFFLIISTLVVVCFILT